MTEFTVQCEGCDEQVPEPTVEYEELPGATLAWCEDCREPSKAEMYL